MTAATFFDPVRRLPAAADLADRLDHLEDRIRERQYAANRVLMQQRFERRRRQVIFSGALMATLLIGSIVAGWQAWEANKNAHRAESELQTSVAANAELLAVADERQFAISFPKIAEHSELAIPSLIAIIETKFADDAKNEDKERLAKQQANAAVALMRMNQPEKIWPLLKHQSDPRMRSYLIHRLAPLGADPKVIIARLDVETEVSIRRALILSLGEFTEAQLTTDERKGLLPKLQSIYRGDADGGVHGAVEWLLRTWKEEGLAEAYKR